jgi:fibronectin type 3 domain-containing protein
MRRTGGKRAIFGVTVVLVLGLFPQASQARGRGAFVVQCTWTHTDQSDPVVAPGSTPFGHLHDFFGNRSTNAGSTYDSMLGGDTTCQNWDDIAGYWSPSGLLNGTPVPPIRQGAYYFGDAGGSVQAFPADFRMIAGDKLAPSPGANPHVRWNCGGNTTPMSDHPYNCSGYSGSGVDGVTAHVDFPECWDGTSIDSGDHVSHLAYEDGDGCPGRHPVRVPRLRLRVHYGVQDPCLGATPCGPADSDGNVRFELSSGPYYTMHADFWNTWKQAAFESAVDGCLNAHVTCGEAAPVTPPAPTASATGGTEAVSLTWSGPGGGGITGYKVYRALTPGTETLIATVGRDATSFTDPGLSNGVRYYYEVAAVNSYGDGKRSDEVSAIPRPPDAPGPPALSATAGSGTVRLSWTSPPDNGSRITSYTVYRGTAPGQETLLTTLGSVNTYDDPGLTNGTTYYYRVSAANGGGEGALSNEVSVRPQAAVGTLPGAPRLSTSRATSLGVSLAWSAPSNGGNPISGYRIYRSTSPGKETFLTAVGNVTSYKDMTNVRGVTYYYEVSAMNGVGEGPLSNEARAPAA